ncbi:MAG: aminodeoxychorismate synthase component I [Rhodospirillaceae bacterium]|nr:aminodeoxychorismate synthase component I [Rhodospirillaceae bacterium]
MRRPYPARPCAAAASLKRHLVNTAPVVLSIPFRDPAAAFAPLTQDDMAVLLDSALPGPQGKFSYIAVDPVRTIRCTPAPWRVTVDGQARDGDPFSVVAAELAKFPRTKTGPAPFSGGAVGFFSYELGGVLEKLPAPKTTPWPMDMVVGIYDTVVAFDMAQHQARVIAPTATRAEALAQRLGTARPVDGSPIKATWRAETARTVYESTVARALEAIHAGDIYQANITQRFLAEISENTASYDLYLRLRAATPAPFAAFMNAGEGLHILSASPERFLKADAAGGVETRPIKGTRPRGHSEAEDRALAAELLASAKDRAENLMIVDLLRNDLARVCVPGSVNVPELCGLETFPAVHHLVSVVTGQLRPTATAVDLLRAAFPGGSVTGAPKIKAMEVIHDLEAGARGPYCGAVAWLGFDGAMDSSIVIRTLVRQGRRLVAQAGGGIVAESNPAREYEESVTKVKPLLSVLDS